MATKLSKKAIIATVARNRARISKIVSKNLFQEAKGALGNEDKAMFAALRLAFDTGYDLGAGAALSQVAKKTAVFNDEPADVCDECGEEYPGNADDMIGKFHKKSCSLHTNNIV